MNAIDDMEKEIPFDHVTFVDVRVKFWAGVNMDHRNVA